ncbi:hypothetical protein RRG08_018124 [Elysia crispata]|uniref:Uncharacterized protein n=1 Tax=Elysia crispata TaxID=231223 RepID=A0AAE0ZUI1_9GAST|nr:hypothetical protein RRG08_018124 [Elysia crispata]
MALSFWVGFVPSLLISFRAINRLTAECFTSCVKSWLLTALNGDRFSVPRAWNRLEYRTDDIVEVAKDCLESGLSGVQQLKRLKPTLKSAAAEAYRQGRKPKDGNFLLVTCEATELWGTQICLRLN